MEGDRPLFRPLSVRHVGQQFSNVFPTLETDVAYSEQCILSSISRVFRQS